MKRSMPNSGIENRGEENLGIESYGISVTTLEEVFLRVAGGDFDQDESHEEIEGPVSCDTATLQPCQSYAQKRTFHSKLCGTYFRIICFIATIIGRASFLIITTVLSALRFLSMQCCCCCILSRSMFWKHSKALLIKRAKSAQRDMKTIVFQLLIPAVFLLFGLLFLKLKPHPDQQSVTFTTSYFNPLLSGGGGGCPIPFDLNWPIEKEVCDLLHFHVVTGYS